MGIDWELSGEFNFGSYQYLHEAQIELSQVSDKNTIYCAKINEEYKITKLYTFYLKYFLMR
jgi:hypothetical protein